MLVGCIIMFGHRKWKIKLFNKFSNFQSRKHFYSSSVRNLFLSIIHCIFIVLSRLKLKRLLCVLRHTKQMESTEMNINREQETGKMIIPDHEIYWQWVHIGRCRNEYCHLVTMTTHLNFQESIREDTLHKYYVNIFRISNAISPIVKKSTSHKVIVGKISLKPIVPVLKNSLSALNPQRV